MADDNVDNQQGEGSFGEVTERETQDEGSQNPVLVADKVKAGLNTEGETKVEGESTEESGEGKTESDTEGKTEAETEGGEKLTEKGTKLDPDPLSAAHQELANERRVKGRYETVLANPKLLAKFMKEQYGIDVPAITGAAGTEGKTEATAEQVTEYKPEDFESLEDVANVVNGLQKSFREERTKDKQVIDQLSEAVTNLLQGGKQQELLTKTSSSINNLQSLPELTKGNSEYIEGLEEAIVKEYHRLDFDQNTGAYRGQHSLEEVGQNLVQVARTARKAGSQRAQTIVKDKSQGKVVTSSETDEGTGEENLNPADSIALGISKTFK